MSPTTTRRTADPRITTARMRAAHADISERFGDKALEALEAMGKAWGTNSSRDILTHYALLPQLTRDSLNAAIGASLLASAVLGGERCGD